MHRSLFIALAGLTALASAMPASAAVIVNGVSYTEDQSFQIFFGGSEPGLSANMTLTFDEVDQNGDYLFSYSLTNTSGAPNTAQSRITAFGFNTSPDPDDANSWVNGTYNVVADGSISNGNQNQVEICFKNGQDNNCGGGGSDPGVTLGQTGGGQLLLAFGGGDPGDITLTQFTVRYQSTGADGEGSAIGHEVPPLPEPSTWAMMLMGFAGAGFALRRRRDGIGRFRQLA